MIFPEMIIQRRGFRGAVVFSKNLAVSLSGIGAFLYLCRLWTLISFLRSAKLVAVLR